MAYAVLAPFFLAIFAPALTQALGHRAGWALAALPAGLFIYFTGFIAPVSSGERFVFTAEWVPSYGVNLSFFVDGLSLVFALLITGIGAFILIYAGGYLKGHEHHGRFFSFLLMFMGSMLGLVLADNVITLFIFWELTSITSFLLIGFDHRREASRRAAIQALVVTGGGGLALLAGLILMAGATGTMEMSEMLSLGNLGDNPLYVPILLLVLGGAFTKSAQVPFHFWLPNAMEAPTPVSAYLHSATMVKAGVYLVMRVQPALGDTILWSIILPAFGGATLLTGVFLGLRQTDLKLMLAYTTVASLGLLIMLTGTSDLVIIEGAVLYLIAHSLFKGGLFMVAGTIDHEAGTRDITRLGGLRAAMPLTFAAAALCALSMAGLPPFFGFIAKEIMYKGLSHVALIPTGLPAADIAAWVLVAAAVIGNAMMLVIGFAVAFKPFLGTRVDTPKSAHEGPVMLWIGPVVLSVLGLIAALTAHETGDLFIEPMTAAVSGVPIELDLHLWPSKFDAAVMLSILTIGLGLLIFSVYETARSGMGRIADWVGWGPDKGFDQAVRGIVAFAEEVTGIFQHGELRGYMIVTFGVTFLVLILPLAMIDGLPAIPAIPDLFVYEWGVLALALAGLVAVFYAKTRLTAIISLGIQGFAVALIFLIFGAPDLSFTQFMVETLSVVILTLVLTRLSLAETDTRGMPRALGDGTIAIGVGAAFTLVLLSVTQQPLDLRLSAFFTEFSQPVAHGRNIVNVILVDFRALDTFGEITVVLVAGLACLAAIRLRKRRPPAAQSHGTELRNDADGAISQTRPLPSAKETVS